MPTSHNVTPHRVLPFVLAIPLLLLFFTAYDAGPGVPGSVSTGKDLSGLSHRFPLPIPWQDDVFTTGLPAPEPVGKRTAGKGPLARVVVSAEPGPVRREFRSGPVNIQSSIMSSLAASLFLSRPPPPVPGSAGIGGSEGNDGVSHSLT